MFGFRANAARTAAAVLVALAFAPALGGCSTSIADIPLGTPADAPRARDATGPYLPVNQLPPERDETAMNPAERAKVQAELVAARDRQASATANKDQAANKDQNQSAK